MDVLSKMKREKVVVCSFVYSFLLLMYLQIVFIGNIFPNALLYKNLQYTISKLKFL